MTCFTGSGPLAHFYLNLPFPSSLWSLFYSMSTLPSAISPPCGTLVLEASSGGVLSRTSLKTGLLHLFQTLPTDPLYTPVFVEGKAPPISTAVLKLDCHTVEGTCSLFWNSAVRSLRWVCQHFLLSPAPMPITC